VKFIVDAQLPQRLALALNAAGHDAVHTLSLPDQNRSKDTAIRQLADSDGRIVISKDADFVSTHLVLGSPARLLEISTGNIPNAQLLPLILGNLARIELAFLAGAHIELTATAMIFHS
jgi:predicted nuclease of predicted toxin-antitoxin system